ncbi:succinylglutamate desuccinylase/aspartoacylase family protein [Natronoglomus mannanivorans]|uniref:Succinylglutamate desuccinylase/aspartoacylase family protein n=1 Tax=Natronoglomus mannanivorans TaxID=2979990 RepID=A0AAP3E2H2_9EURY|nr:succinylglutamate desuccinylase/aspartoacylase family protein [Halobacteria archaeon AArc-xg1-1]
MTTDRPDPFQYDVEVESGTKRHVRESVCESYLGDPVEIPVTIVNGAHDGPTVFLTAAIHGDELNGVKVVQEVADNTDPDRLHGTLVCVHVCNVPAYQAQQRYIPVYDQDLNREFPGRANGNTAQRMAHQLYHRFLAGCDLGIDFHTSTRNRTTMYHARADLTNPDVERLARAFASNVVLYGDGEGGSLRSAATADGVPTITVEMGRAHRFQPALIERALAGVESVLAEYGLLPGEPVRWPGWYTTTTADSEKRWLRAQTGGLVEMEWGPSPLVYEGDPICTITNHFKTEEHVVTAPFTGLLVGVLENPVAAPGHPLCHLVRLEPETRDEIEREIERGEFDGYRTRSGEWTGDD